MSVLASLGSRSSLLQKRVCRLAAFAVLGAFLHEDFWEQGCPHHPVRIFAGVTYGCERLAVTHEGGGLVHWARVDLTALGIELYVTPLDPAAVARGWQYRLRPIEDVIEGENLAVAVNGTYFATASGSWLRFPGDLARSMQTVISDHVIAHGPWGASLQRRVAAPSLRSPGNYICFAAREPSGRTQSRSLRLELSNLLATHRGEGVMSVFAVFEARDLPRLGAAIENIVDADPVAAHVRELMADRAQWTGRASDLLQAGTNRSLWPQSARALAGRLRRAQTLFRTLGIKIVSDRRGGWERGQSEPIPEHRQHSQPRQQ